MKNVVVWRFHSPAVYPALIKLQESGQIDIKAWFGDTTLCPYCTHNIHTLLEYARFEDHSYQSVDWEIYNAVYPSLFRFVSTYAPKKALYYTSTVHDFVNLFNILFNYYYHLLTSKKIDMILFGFIPHQGPELVLYELAKALNIKTVLVYQSLFPNKFYYLYEIDDYGTWQGMQMGNPVDIKFERKHEKSLFYMNTKQKRYRAKEEMGLPKYRRIAEKVPGQYRYFDWVYWFVSRLMKYKKNRDYRKNLERYCQPPDYSKPYVYFPLHLQPELTTSALGGQYVDQLLAVERLREILPDDWHIYVKENPKQAAKMRSPQFFDRLAGIKNVRLVASSINTYELMKNCIFLATITGTAGWEAISGGKNVLVFGHAWYKKLPGVFTFDTSFSLDSILNYTIDHAELEQKLGELMGKMPDGIVDPYYSAIYESFSEEINIALLEKAMSKIIAAAENY